MAALSQGISTTDAAIGLIVFPVATLAWVSLRAGSPPLRLYGTGGHCWTIAVAIAAFIVLPVATLLFFGATQVLAAIRGYAGCELFAVSNWLLGRDDQIACMVHTPIDAIEARMSRRP